MGSVFYLIFFIISFLASCIGAISGIGGGVIIKPTLDAFGVLQVSTISFLSGCTVLSMSAYAIAKNTMVKESLVEAKIGTPLAIGAAIGGVIGKSGFHAVADMFSDKEMVGAVQAICLLLITVGTLFYIRNKKKIRTLHCSDPLLIAGIGLILGITSVFLGIGGGPMNMVVLLYFFSMDTKKAAQNSLYVILFSQITSLISTILAKNVPEFSPWLLVLMIAGGVLGGIVGRKMNKTMKEVTVERLFIVAMYLIIGLNIYNIYRFLM